MCRASSGQDSEAGAKATGHEGVPGPQASLEAGYKIIDNDIDNYCYLWAVKLYTAKESVRERCRVAVPAGNRLEFVRTVLIIH